jgi:hypothetical protein
MSVRSPYTRSERFSAFRLDPTKDNIVSVIDEQEHSRLRSIMIHGVRISLASWVSTLPLTSGDVVLG